MLLHLFLSTLSLRRATLGAGKPCNVCGISIHALLAESDRYNFRWPLPGNRYFYPRSPCGERPIIFCKLFHGLVISIHALLAESDAGFWAKITITSKFLSTLSLRRATFAITDLTLLPFHISIHALLAESDPRIALMVGKPPAFLSTLSLRRATDRRR